MTCCCRMRVCHCVTTFQLRKLWIKSFHSIVLVVVVPFTWPLHCTLLDFFLRGVDKERCLHTTITQPLARLVPAAAVTPSMLMYMFSELEYRCDVCCTTDGAVIEHLWTVTARSLKFDYWTYESFFDFQSCSFFFSKQYLCIKIIYIYCVHHNC